MVQPPSESWILCLIYYHIFCKNNEVGNQASIGFAGFAWLHWIFLPLEGWDP